MEVTLRPWSDGDLGVLRAVVGDPAMMEHLGGPEPEARILERQARYAEPGSGAFVLLDDGGDPAGFVGFWAREWQGETVHEVGWSVLPALQGRGLAVAGARAVIAAAFTRAPGRPVHAFPAVDNPPSNRVCERAGMALLGPFDGEYPPGHPLRCNDWAIAAAPMVS